MHEELGAYRTRTAGPKWPKGYFIPYGTMINDKMERRKEETFRVMVKVYSSEIEKCLCHHTQITIHLEY